MRLRGPKEPLVCPPESRPVETIDSCSETGVTVKKSRFSEDQVVRILGEVSAGKSVREVCKLHKVSEGTLYTWKRKYAGMESDDMRRLRELEAENAALKRIVAEQALTIDARGSS
ncbi:transposase [bacterium]|nr:MAG: transposase [bacterium]